MIVLRKRMKILEFSGFYVSWKNVFEIFLLTLDFDNLSVQGVISRVITIMH